MTTSNQPLTKPSPNRGWIWAIMAVALIGIADTLYLILEAYYGGGVKCFIVGGCTTVLTSKYAVFYGIPLTWWGLGFYVSVFLAINIFEMYGFVLWLKLLSLITSIGLLVSLTLLCLQVFVIKALCFYCLTSLASSTALFVLILILKNKVSSYRSKDNPSV